MYPVREHPALVQWTQGERGEMGGGRVQEEDGERKRGELGWCLSKGEYSGIYAGAASLTCPVDVVSPPSPAHPPSRRLRRVTFRGHLDT